MTTVPKLLTNPCTMRMPRFMTDCCTHVSSEKLVISFSMLRLNFRWRRRMRNPGKHK